MVRYFITFGIPLLLGLIVVAVVYSLRRRAPDADSAFLSPLLLTLIIIGGGAISLVLVIFVLQMLGY